MNISLKLYLNRFTIILIYKNYLKFKRIIYSLLKYLIINHQNLKIIPYLVN